MIERKIGEIQALHFPDQCCMLSAASRSALGIRVNDLVKINTDSGQIVRRVRRSIGVPYMNEFVFLRPEDIDFLNATLEDQAEITKDTEGVECP